MLSAECNSVSGIKLEELLGELEKFWKIIRRIEERYRWTNRWTQALMSTCTWFPLWTKFSVNRDNYIAFHFLPRGSFQRISFLSVTVFSRCFPTCWTRMKDGKCLPMTPLNKVWLLVIFRASGHSGIIVRYSRVSHNTLRADSSWKVDFFFCAKFFIRKYYTCISERRFIQLVDHLRRSGENAISLVLNFLKEPFKEVFNTPTKSIDYAVKFVLKLTSVRPYHH